MNELLNTKIISLLSDTSQVSNEEMQNAYGCFMKQVRTVSQSKNDSSEVFRMLNITRIEFDSLDSSPLYEQGKKCPKICLSTKGAGIYQF